MKKILILSMLTLCVLSQAPLSARCPCKSKPKKNTTEVNPENVPQATETKKQERK